MTELFLLLKSHLQQGASHTSLGTPGLCDIRCECVCLHTCCSLCVGVCAHQPQGFYCDGKSPREPPALTGSLSPRLIPFSKFVCFSLFFPSLPFISGLDLGLRRLSVAVRSLCVCARFD